MSTQVNFLTSGWKSLFEISQTCKSHTYNQTRIQFKINSLTKEVKLLNYSLDNLILNN